MFSFHWETLIQNFVKQLGRSFFCQKVNGVNTLNTFTEGSILDFCQGSTYFSDWNVSFLAFQYKSPSFPESFIPTDRFSKISETKNRSRMGHLSDIHSNSNTRQVSDSHRSTTDTTEKAGNNSSKIRPNKTSNTSKSRSRKKRHCVCECPNVVDKTTEIQKLLKDSKENSNKKVKPFRTGLEPENLISKRDFEEQDRVTIIKKAKGEIEFFAY